MDFRQLFLLILQFILALLVGCSRESIEPAGSTEDQHGSEAQGPAMTNRISVPEAVRRNLGITFAKVESRSVAQTIRAPGRFELLPEARREYRTMLAGRIEVVVRQYDRIEVGTPIYRLASPEWRELQNRLSEAESTIRQTEARVSCIPALIAAHQRHERILEDSIAMWEARVKQLEETHGSGAVSATEFTAAQNTLSVQRAELAEILEKEADLEGQVVSAQAEHDAAHSRFRLLIATASTLLGIAEAELAAPYELDQHLHSGIHRHEEAEVRPAANWRRIDEVLVKASMPGVVATLDAASGSWASAGALVLTTVEPDRLRFRAMGMQSDLGRLRSGLRATIVPPAGGSIELQDTMWAELMLGLGADPQERTVEMIAIPASLATWARPGVTAYLEVITGGGSPELAIPMSSVIQDGLSRVLFRRDPSDPDKVIRLEADLGVNDGRWVVVQSGVRDGDEVVLDGIYQLMIATSGSVQKGGHFHADGTFHAGEEG